MGGIKNSIDLELEVFNPSPHVFFPLAFFDFFENCYFKLMFLCMQNEEI
jgi:hypothetical protein